jgi:hypothetical protein
MRIFILEKTCMLVRKEKDVDVLDPLGIGGT